MKNIFLHGLGQNAQSWDFIKNQLPDLKADCPDLFHGAVSYETLFEEMEHRFMDEKEPLRICGLSLGAILALDYAIRHGKQVDSLILIGAQYQVPTALIDLQNMIFRCLPSKFFSNSGLSKDSMLCLTKSMRTLDFSRNLSKIRCPVTIVCGQKDYANLKAARALRERLPQAKLYIIPGVGHEVNQLAPDALVNIIREQWIPGGTTNSFKTVRM